MRVDVRRGEWLIDVVELGKESAVNMLQTGTHTKRRTLMRTIRTFGGSGQGKEGVGQMID